MTTPTKALHWSKTAKRPVFPGVPRVKRIIVAPILAIFVICGLSATGVAGYAGPFLSGWFKDGYVVVIGLYGFCWPLAILFLYIAVESVVLDRATAAREADDDADPSAA